MEMPGLILGIGNCLLTDDGVGVHAARLLSQDPPPYTQVLEVGTDFLSALPWLEKAHTVLAIDAMDAGGAPGSLYHCTGRDLAQRNTGGSQHEWDLMALLPWLDPALRPSVYFLGVQPARLEFGLELSPLVQAALPEITRAAHAFLATGAYRSKS